MNRRQFIKKMIATTAIIATSVAAIIQISPEAPCRPLTDAEREYIVSQALMTDAGREAMAKAMCEPIRAKLNYQEVGKKLLFA